MSLFIALLTIGLTGLIVMAFPALGGHGHFGAHVTGHTGAGLGHAGGHVGGAHGAVAAPHAAGAAAHVSGEVGHAHSSEASAAAGAARLIPSPRMIFSLLALYGLFGNAIQAYLPHGSAASLAYVLAALPAIGIERYIISPLWNMLFAFQGKPCSPLEALTFSEAEAVTQFHNGKGIVSVVRDGRMVQFTARLPQDQIAMPIHVGDKLRIEEVDAAKESVTVSIQ